MDAQDLKDRVRADGNLRRILMELGMKHVTERAEYFSCCMPDGNNRTSTIVYKNSFKVDAYTRDISDGAKYADIFSLVSFINKSSFTESIKWMCDQCGYDYYGSDYEAPASLKWMRQMMSMKTGTDEDDDFIPLKPLDEYVLGYYRNIQNVMFQKDRISLQTQREFEIGYDLETHRITIPIRDELNTLVGVKGRLFQDYIHSKEMKYLYLFRCSKSKILFGLNKTYSYIKRSGFVYVFESEKAVMQMWDAGIKNCVAIGSHKISKRQSILLTRLGVDVIFCYDKEVGIIHEKDENDKRKMVIMSSGNLPLDKEFWNNQFRFFASGQKLGIMYDRMNKLPEKQSPSDDLDQWEYLKDNIKWITRKAEEEE